MTGDYEYYLTDGDGKVYLYSGESTSDDGTAIAAQWVSKVLDFTEQHPDTNNRFYTIYKAQLLYEDKSANTVAVLYVSDDSGENFSTESKTIGEGDGYAKKQNYFIIMTGAYFQFKVYNSSTDKDLLWTGIELEFEPRGEYFS